MGCCISHDEKVNTIEVVLDENGVARRVAAGQGTHLIRTTPDKETHMTRKPPTKPSELSSLSRPQVANYPAKSPMLPFSKTKKVHPNNDTTPPIKEEKEEQVADIDNEKEIVAS